MTNPILSECIPPKELIDGETFMVGSQEAIYWLKNVVHQKGKVYGVKVWWNSPKRPEQSKFIEHPLRLVDVNCYIGMLCTSMDLRLGDYVHLQDQHGLPKKWRKVVEIQEDALGGVCISIGVKQPIHLSSSESFFIVRK